MYKDKKIHELSTQQVQEVLAQYSVHTSSLNPNLHGGKRIGWLLGSGQNVNRANYIKTAVGRLDQSALMAILFKQIVTRGKDGFIKKKPNTQDTYVLTPDYLDTLRQQVAPMLPNCSLIVINNADILKATLEATAPMGTIKTLAPYRGSVFIMDLFDGVPALVVDDVSKLYVPDFSAKFGGKYENNKGQAYGLLKHDLRKAIRLWQNPDLVKNNFADNFRIVNQQTIPEYLDWLSKQKVGALDTEVSMGEITCLGITGTPDYTMGSAQTWILPIINTQNENSLHMHPLAYLACLEATVNHTGMIKPWHNSQYDLSQLLRINTFTPNEKPLYPDIPSTYAGKDYLHQDTQHMWGAFQARLPQSLAAMSSCLLDNYYYWKGEIAGTAVDNQTQKKYAVPTTRDGLLVYWQYCGRDCHNTLASFIRLIPIVFTSPNMKATYAQKMRFSVGPLLHIGMRGMTYDPEETVKLFKELEGERDKALDALEEASLGLFHKDNPPTPALLTFWLYDVLRAESPKGRLRKSDAPTRSIIADQSLALFRAVELIEAYSEPKALINSTRKRTYDAYKHPTSLGQLPYTGRFSSGKSPFFKGGSAQNMNWRMKSRILPDAADHCLLDIDLSSADLYGFVSFCLDPTMLDVVLDPAIDNHLYNASIFLGKPIEELMEAKANGEEWLMGKTGVRQGFKPVGHGSNYLMAAFTCTIQMGRKNIDPAARAMGLNPDKWVLNDRVKFVSSLMAKYFTRFPGQKGLRKWLADSIKANKGWVTPVGGRSVHFPMWDSPDEVRNVLSEALALLGQGSTAGVMNKGLDELYFTPYKDGKSFLNYYSSRVIMQTHDSLTISMPIHHAYENNVLPDLLTRLSNHVINNGIGYTIPCDVNIGTRWGKSMQGVANPSDPNSVLCALLAAKVKEMKDE